MEYFTRHGVLCRDSPRTCATPLRDAGCDGEAHSAAGIQPPDTYVLEHGYCRSVYVTDPNGLILEFTLDHPAADAISRDRREDAHRELKRWLEGNHQSNNTYR